MVRKPTEKSGNIIQSRSSDDTKRLGIWIYDWVSLITVGPSCRLALIFFIWQNRALRTHLILIKEAHDDTYSSLFYHAIFSTKQRKEWISQTIEDRVWRDIGGIARGIDCTAIAVGGIEDHIHALLMVPPKYAPSEVVQKIKANSLRFIHREFSDLRSFGWQDGFGIFSVSKSAVPAVIDYIRNQRIHHAKMSFEEEYLELLRLHDVDARDDTFVFG